MYKVDIQEDAKAAAAIEARRNREKQRQSRIFNARFRTMGVDVEGLKKQVEERKLREEAEKLRDEAFDADRVQCDKIAQMLEEEERLRKRQLNLAELEFREKYQKPSSRREWDLNDPETIHKRLPARVSDDDPRCGPSSMQRFDGEDFSALALKNLQKHQNKKNWEEQRAEWKKNIADRKYADILDGVKRIELDLRALKLAQLEEECRKAKTIAVANYNQALAAEVAEQQRLAQQREQDDNCTEIYNNLTSDILTENPDVAISLYGPHRMVPYRWKGMTPEQLKKMWKTQQDQRKEKQRMQEEERLRDAEWDQQRLLADRAAMVMEAQEQDFRHQLRKGTDVYNRELADAQKSNLEYLEKELYTNVPTAHYYLQFNTSSR